MHLHKTILQCTSHDTTRLAIQHVYVDIAERYAIATDGHLLVLVPIDPEPDEVDGYVSAMAIQEAAKQKGCFKDRIHHFATETLVVGSGLRVPNPFHDDPTPPVFPDWRNLFPRVTHQPLMVIDMKKVGRAADALSPIKEKAVVAVTCDLAKLGTDPVLLTMDATPQGAPEDPRDWSRAKALVMPIRAEHPVGHRCLGEADLRAQLADATTRLAEAQARIQILEAAASVAAPAVPEPVDPDLAQRFTDLEYRYTQLQAQQAALATDHATLYEDYMEALRDMQRVLVDTTAGEMAI